MKRNRNKKRKFTMSLMTHSEKARGMSPYDSYAWTRRKLVRKRKECLRNKNSNSETVMKKFKSMFKAYKLA